MATAALKELSDVLQTARHTKEATQILATLDQTQTPLLELRQHLGSCGDIMKMLANTPDHVAADHVTAATATAP